MMEKLIIVGASGHGKVVADIAAFCGWPEIVFLDDDETIEDCSGYPIVGTTKDIDNQEGCFVVAIGNVKTRQLIQQRIEESGKQVATLVHPNAVIGSNVTIDAGTVVMAGAVINPDTSIGKGCIVNTCSSVDHDCVVGDYVHVSVGSHLAGTVHVGDRTWIGIGVVVSNNLEICSDCMIGAGAVVVNNIEEAGTYVGVPARKRK